MNVSFRKSPFKGLYLLLRRLLSLSNRRRKPYATLPCAKVKRIPIPAEAGIIISKSYRCGLERTAADMMTPQPGDNITFAPQAGMQPPMQDWGELIVSPSIGQDGELSEPEVTDIAVVRPQLPPPLAGTEICDAEIHAMLGELEAGESIVAGDVTAEERLAIADFDIRAYV